MASCICSMIASIRSFSDWIFARLLFSHLLSCSTISLNDLASSANSSVIIGRNAGYTGSGAIFKLVKDGLGYYTKGATGIVDVEDVAKSMILLMESEITGERFTISAENYYYKQFFSEIAKGMGVKAPSKEAKPWMLGLAWRAAKLASLFTGKAAALTSDAAKSSLNISLYSNDKIRNSTGITFKPLHQSIQEVCAGLKKL